VERWDPAHAQAVVPDQTLTPGVVRTTDATDVCSHGTNQLRHMSRERSDAIVAEYGLPGGRHEAYEIDLLIPLSIGGSDDDEDLWPQPRRMIESEWTPSGRTTSMRLHNLVCAGQIEITVAQKAIADDWTKLGCATSPLFSLGGRSRLTCAAAMRRVAESVLIAEPAAATSNNASREGFMPRQPALTGNGGE
jgi:hypothetical protein